MASNIFEEAGKSGTKKSLSGSGGKNPDPHESKGAGPKTDMKEVIESFKKKHDEIQLKLEEIYAKVGLSSHTLKSYLDNPSNFTKEQWDFLQKEREDLFGSLMGQLNVAGINPVIKKSPKEKHSKPPGARRNWIPIR